MKKYSFFTMLISLPVFLMAQPYNNEWIAFTSGQPQSNQQYYRIGVWKEGIYRITLADMVAAGVDSNSWFQPSKFQLFHNGAEQFIEVTDNGQQGIFRTGDYIEFYGKPADGELDSRLYDTSASQPNPYFNLFNDTAAYFLTYNPAAASTRRMIIENDTSFSGYTPQSYYLNEEVKQYTDEYNVGWRDVEKVADNSYTSGEGYLLNHNACNMLAPFQQSFQMNQLNGTEAEVELVLAGANTDDHPVIISVNGTSYIFDTFYQYEIRKYHFTVTGISNGSLTVTIAPQSTPSTYMNYVHIAYIKVIYKRNYDFTGLTVPRFIGVDSTGGKALVVLNNLNVAAPTIYIIEGDTIKHVLLKKNGSTASGLIPVNNQSKKCFITDLQQPLTAAGNVLFSIPGNNGYFSNYKFLAANKDFLLISHKKLWNGALQYAAYRDSTGFPAVLADIDELYDQFSWGIRKHPLAIRNYCDYLLDQLSPQPKFLFLLGKSVVSLSARSGSNYTMNLVPTFGEPPSDQMFTSYLNTTQFKPELATGRLAAQSDTDIINYLDKVKQYELVQKQFPAAWMKRILHFGGGNNADEQALLSDKLKKYKSIIEDTLFGGHVTTFLKNSTDPIQINQTKYLQDLIDDGCSMMTFYGHAAGSAFDVSTDAPENYTNTGKYPVILAQSCLVGDIHSSVQLLNERFVLAKQKAAIAFMAVPDKAYAEELDVYSTEFHKQTFSYQYGATIGECMKKTVDNVITADASEKSVCMNYTLHGDPALVMNLYPKREMSISDPDVFFTPAMVTTQTENFTVNVVVTNLAKTDHQPFQLKLTRTFPDGKTIDTVLIVQSLHFKDTFAINLPVDFQNGAGLNTFNAVIDEDNVIDEYDNTINNHASAPLIINSTDINPVYPQQFAIVPTGNISLKATTANLFAAPRNYRFEVDTNDHFNSIKHSGIAANASGIVNYVLPFVLDSNIVYYWRVSNDSISSTDTTISHKYQWKTSSFIYKPGITGWSQAHFHQFRNDKYTNLIYNDLTGGQFDFVADSNSIQALNFYHPILGNADPGLYLNNALIEGGGCGPAGNAFALIVLDSLDNTYAWNNQDQYLGQFNSWDPGTGAHTCRARYERYFLYPYNNPTYVNKLASVLIDSIPCGDYIVLWAGRTGIHGDFDYSAIHTPLFNALISLGATNVNQLKDGDIFLCFTRKCYPGSTIFYIGDSINTNLAINTLIGGRWNKGIMTSSLVGPAMQWNSLHWDFHSTEAIPNQDSISLSVFGINSKGAETKFLDSISPNQFDVYNLNNIIDAKTYPYLKLKAYKEDLGAVPTPPQLDKWQVYYQPVPEGSLNTRYYSLLRDTVEEGEQVYFSIAFENISVVAMDTLLVNYYIYDNNNVKHILGSKRLHRPLPAADTIMTSISFNSLGYAGNNTLWVEVNPNNDQPEQYHFNNITSLPFYVKKDNINPLLDVTFDGVHILNGDIVSAKPGILIQLRDENKFIALNDTSDFRVRIIYPDGSIHYLAFEQSPGISTSKSLLKWTPAVLPKNSFKIEYYPDFGMDGTYQLIVSASDESGNLSGVNDYKINYEIINRSTITNVINYPNPFSTATKFVFVLTGSEIPPDFNIQIMTITGKVVRTITRSELGNIRIGRNITDYAWDGRDEFGDRLANGIYLYRVITRINGEKIEQRETSADQYFTKGWGKMYLIR